MQPSPVALDMEARLRSQADATGWLDYGRFIHTALYAPGAGYYTRERLRVGRAADRDFYTAASLGQLFGELIAEAAARLSPFPPGECSFVEIGAEPGQATLEGIPHPFREHRVLRVGEPLALPSPCVVFANEVLDAQPFRRFRFRAGAWRELGVNLATEPWEETEGCAEEPLPALPATAAEGYVLDYPTGSLEWLKSLVAPAWEGTLILIDYGLPWEVLAQERPAGTGRTYWRHTMGDLLHEQPGERDITCHVCWDLLEPILVSAGFRQPRLERQESFLVSAAPQTLARVIGQRAGQFSRERQTLKELLHPQHLGQKFQVLTAQRTRS